MTEGYAIIAIPVTHYNHGLTLIVSHHGPIHGKALEGDAARVGGEMTEYDPDGSWIESRR